MESSINEKKKYVLYSEYITIWKKSNSKFDEILDDTLYANLGCMIIDILTHCVMINK